MSAAIPQPTGELSPEKTGAGHEPRHGRRAVRLLVALGGVESFGDDFSLAPSP